MADLVSENLYLALEETIGVIKEEMIANGKHVSGSTANSLRRDGWDIKGADYFRVIIYGRRPGRIPANMQSILLKWAAAKGITFPNAAAANRWAYFTSRKIRDFGTKQFREGERLDILDKAKEHLLRRANELIQDEFRVTINKSMQ